MTWHRVVHIHHGMKPWPRPKNHLDGRCCPTCKTTVHGAEAQAGHYDFELDRQEFERRVVGWIVELAKHVGITENQVSTSFDQDKWEWGADVADTEGELEAAE